LAQVAHVTRDSDTTFKVKRSRSQGRGTLWRPPAQLVQQAWVAFCRSRCQASVKWVDQSSIPLALLASLVHRPFDRWFLRIVIFSQIFHITGSVKLMPTTCRVCTVFCRHVMSSIC